MVIEAGNYIKLSYTGSVNGVPFDTTDAEAAKKGHIFREGYSYASSIVKVGAGQVLAGFDEDLVGKDIGTEYKLVIPAAKAFGEHKKEEVKAIDKKAFNHMPELFERVVVDGREGAIVNKVGSRYLVDFNHPLAGQTVEYTYTIEAVVSDPVECLAGMSKLLTGHEMKISNAHKNSVYIEVPALFGMYNKNWFVTQYMIMQEALVLFPDVDAVKFVESFPRPKKEGGEATAEKTEETVPEKKPVAKKTAKKTEGETAGKKPVAKMTTKKAEGETAEKKLAVKKTTKKAEDETVEKKPAVKKNTKKAAEKKEE